MIIYECTIVDFLKVKVLYMKVLVVYKEKSECSLDILKRKILLSMNVIL